MARRFTILEDFFSEPLQTQYLRGYSYEAAEGSGLSEMVDEWIAEGRAREGGPASEVSGSGDAQ